MSRATIIGAITRFTNIQRQQTDIETLIRRRDRLAHNENALEVFDDGEGKRASGKHRKEQHDQLKDAVEDFEDFLYYQIRPSGFKD